MNRDNVLFTTIGLLTGFLAGYVMHEVMTERQPARRMPGQAAVQTGAPTPGAAANPAAPAMAEVGRLRQRLAENPQDAETLRRLGNLFYDIREWEQAAELYERYLEVRPDDLDVTTDLGACYRSIGDAERALEKFRRVRALDPEHWQSRFNEILVLAFDLGQLEAAGRAMVELQALQPDNPNVARLADELGKRLAGGGGAGG